MTIEPTTPKSVYTITTTGPYALRDGGGNPWPYVAGGVAVSVVKSGAITTLVAGTDYTLSPDGGASGNLTLSAGALAAHTGGQLIITRTTPIEQGWIATTGPREAGLAAQLDQLAMNVQELSTTVSASLRLAASAVAPAALTDGKVVLFDNGSFTSGPSPADIANAAAQATIATTQANIATTQAAIATTQAGLSTAAATVGQNSALSAQSAASSASAALGALGNALVNGIGAVRVTNGDLILSYNSPFVTGASLVDGNLIISYGV